MDDLSDLKGCLTAGGFALLLLMGVAAIEYTIIAVVEFLGWLLPIGIIAYLWLKQSNQHWDNPD